MLIYMLILMYLTFAIALVTVSNEQEGFMAVLVDYLPYCKLFFNKHPFGLILCSEADKSIQMYQIWHPSHQHYQYMYHEALFFTHLKIGDKIFLRVILLMCRLLLVLFCTHRRSFLK